MENKYKIYYETSKGELTLISDQDNHSNISFELNDGNYIYTGSFKDGSISEKDFLDIFINCTRNLFSYWDEETEPFEKCYELKNIFSDSYIKELKDISRKQHQFPFINIMHSEHFTLNDYVVEIKYKNKYFRDLNRKSHSYDTEIIVNDSLNNKILHLPFLLETTSSRNKIYGIYISEVYRYELVEEIFLKIEEIIQDIISLEGGESVLEDFDYFFSHLNYKYRDIPKSIYSLHKTCTETINLVKGNNELYKKIFSEITPEIMNLIYSERGLEYNDKIYRRNWR